MIQNIPLSYYLVISTLMFFIGIYGFLTRRNLITMLMSVELILNSVNINFVAFNRYLYPQQLQGHFFMLIVIAVAAAEAAGTDPMDPERDPVPDPDPTRIRMLQSTGRMM